MDTTEPTSIRAGDSLGWRCTLPGFPASAGWRLVYRLVPRSGGEAYLFAASAEGDDFAVSLSVSATSLWSAGEYTLVGAVEQGEGDALQRHTVRTSSVTVLPNLMKTAALDSRGAASRIVDAIDAWLSGRAKWAGERVIGDRTIKDHPLPDLLRLRDYYARLASIEAAAERLANGMGRLPRVMVRM